MALTESDFKYNIEKFSEFLNAPPSEAIKRNPISALHAHLASVDGSIVVALDGSIMLMFYDPANQRVYDQADGFGLSLPKAIAAYAKRLNANLLAVALSERDYIWIKKARSDLTKTLSDTSKFSLGENPSPSSDLTSVSYRAQLTEVLDNLSAYLEKQPARDAYPYLLKSLKAIGCKLTVNFGGKVTVTDFTSLNLRRVTDFSPDGVAIAVAAMKGTTWADIINNYAAHHNMALQTVVGNECIEVRPSFDELFSESSSNSKSSTKHNPVCLLEGVLKAKRSLIDTEALMEKFVEQNIGYAILTDQVEENIEVDGSMKLVLLSMGDFCVYINAVIHPSKSKGHAFVAHVLDTTRSTRTMLCSSAPSPTIEEAILDLSRKVENLLK